MSLVLVVKKQMTVGKGYTQELSTLFEKYEKNPLKIV